MFRPQSQLNPILREMSVIAIAPHPLNSIRNPQYTLRELQGVITDAIRIHIKRNLEESRYEEAYAASKHLIPETIETTETILKGPKLCLTNQISRKNTF